MIYQDYGLFENDVEYASNWENIISICNDLDIKNYLNIGLGNIKGSDARRWNFFITDNCPSIKEVINLELERSFCDSVKNSPDPLINNVIQGDVRSFDTSDLDVDMIFWSHGPRS